jgi:hypothetical protein
MNLLMYELQDCQRDAWKSHLKYECKLLADYELLLLLRAPLRLLCRRAKGSLNNRQLDAIQKLGSHSDNYREASNKWGEIVSSSEKKNCWVYLIVRRTFKACLAWGYWFQRPDTYCRALKQADGIGVARVVH